MATIDTLDFVIVYYSGDAKIARVAFSGLFCDDPIELINQYWINDDQTFYTKATIEYNLRTIYTVDFNQ
jgi:hypothetical protein